MHVHLRAGNEMLDLRFLEVGVDIELAGRHERHQPLAGRDEIAFLNRTIADDAIIGCLQHREGKVAGGFVALDFQRTDGTLSFLALGFEDGNIGLGSNDIGIAAGKICLRLIKSRIRIIEICGGADRLRLQVALTLLLDLRAAHGGLEGSLLGLGLHEARLGAFDLRIDAAERSERWPGRGRSGSRRYQG
jgi:hypothetical protein